MTRPVADVRSTPGEVPGRSLVLSHPAPRACLSPVETRYQRLLRAMSSCDSPGKAIELRTTSEEAVGVPVMALHYEIRACPGHA